ncbi:hypothetical protein [Streptomyces sp. PU-14G]|uniref:hypothetical protein n=1 Tax=Streptomyces sp. PU-14G TaxID=2800808 RepID=UPI0034E04D33
MTCMRPRGPTDSPLPSGTSAEDEDRRSPSGHHPSSEAFARTLQAVRSGGGPTEAWRPYLLTAVRRTAAAWSETARRTELAPDFDRWLFEPPAGSHLSQSAGESAEERMLRQEDGMHAARKPSRPPAQSADARTRLRIASTGRCMDIDDGTMSFAQQGSRLYFLGLDAWHDAAPCTKKAAASANRPRGSRT